LLYRFSQHNSISILTLEVSEADSSRFSKLSLFFCVNTLADRNINMRMDVIFMPIKDNKIPGVIDQFIIRTLARYMAVFSSWEE